MCKLSLSTSGLRFGHDVKIIWVTVMASLRILACITAVLVDCIFRRYSFNMGRSLPKD